MPEIEAFRGLRYDLGHVGALSDVIAPPYDVIDSKLQDALYQRHPANVIRLILNRVEPGDTDDDNRYARAARLLRNWRSEGVLQVDPDPALYVYHQVFDCDGQQLTRRGFMTRVRLERFGEGKIYPHEETHSAAKADRLKLFTACRTNLSQIFGLYPDEENRAQELLQEAITGTTPLEATDHLGVIHRIWPVTDVKVIAEVAAVLGPKPMYVADGHHRYETACNYRDQVAGEQTLAADHPANFVLTMCVSMNDPGMIVLPTHRLFRGLPALSSQQLCDKLIPFFEVAFAGEKPDAATGIWQEIEVEDNQGTIGLYTTSDQKWVVARINDAGRAEMDKLAPEHSDQWRALGVSILHRLIIESLLEGTDLSKPHYVHLIEEVIEGISQGDTDGQAFPLAAVVMPATVDHIRQISEHGERMPAKSTYFYPKLLSGLVLNPLE